MRPIETPHAAGRWPLSNPARPPGARNSLRCRARTPFRERGILAQTRRRTAGWGKSADCWLSLGAMPSMRGRPPHPDPLTPAEAKVLALLRDGLPNSEIATRLGVSINTVRFHVSNLLAKSGLPDRVSLRNWEPGPGDAAPRRLPAFALPFLKPLCIAAGGASAAAVVTLAIVAVGGRAEDPAPLTTRRSSRIRAVVGM